MLPMPHAGDRKLIDQENGFGGGEEAGHDELNEGFEEFHWGDECD